MWCPMVQIGFVKSPQMFIIFYLSYKILFELSEEEAKVADVAVDSDEDRKEKLDEVFASRAPLDVAQYTRALILLNNTN